MLEMADITEGKVPFSYPTLPKEAETWYQIHGPLTKGVRPLILLHGGPGFLHNYLKSLSHFHTAHKRTVIFYDQIGCGKSTRLKEKRLDREFWTVDLFIAEFNNLLSHLEISEYDLLGHSWGGMLGSEIAIRAGSDSSTGLRHLIISNSPASMKLWVSACDEWRAMLPKEIEEVLQKYEASEDYDAKPYQDAVLEFYKRHMCRVGNSNGVDPFPDAFMESDRAVAEDNTVYFTMNGPSEFTVIGNLKEWSVIGRLENIKAPTLVINGEYDEARAICVEPFAKEIKDAEWKTIADASHCSHIEKTEEYCQMVVDWLSRQ